MILFALVFLWRLWEPFRGSPFKVSLTVILAALFWGGGTARIRNGTRAVAARRQRRSTVTAASQRNINVIKESDNETETQASVERRVHGLLGGDPKASLLGDLFPVSTAPFSQLLGMCEQHSVWVYLTHFCARRAKALHFSFMLQMLLSSLVVDGLVTFSHLANITEVPVLACGPIILTVETSLAVTRCFGIRLRSMVEGGTGLKYVDYNDIASLSLYKSPMQTHHVKSSKWFRGSACRACYRLSILHNQTVSLAAGTVTQRATRAKRAAGRVKRQFTMSRSDVW